MLQDLQHAPATIKFVCANPECKRHDTAESYEEIKRQEKLCRKCYSAKNRASIVRDIPKHLAAQQRRPKIKMDKRKVHMTCVRCGQTGLRNTEVNKAENCFFCNSEKSMLPTSQVTVIELTPERSGRLIRAHFKDVVGTLRAIGNKYPELRVSSDYGLLPEATKHGLTEYLDYTSALPGELVNDQRLLALAVYYTAGIPEDKLGALPTDETVSGVLDIIPSTLIIKIYKTHGDNNGK